MYSHFKRKVLSDSDPLGSAKNEFWKFPPCEDFYKKKIDPSFPIFTGAPLTNKLSKFETKYYQRCFIEKTYQKCFTESYGSLTQFW